MALKSPTTMAELLTGMLAGRHGPAIEALFDESSLLHVPGGSGLAGQYQGGDAILGLLGRMAELTAGTLHFTPYRALIADDRVLVLCGRCRASRDIRRLESDAAHVVLCQSAKLREMWMVHENEAQFDAFWA